MCKWFVTCRLSGGKVGYSQKRYVTVRILPGGKKNAAIRGVLMEAQGRSGCKDHAGKETVMERSQSPVLSSPVGPT